MTDDQIAAFAIDGWANYIETGQVHISAKDAANMLKPELIKNINDEQKAFVSRLRNLAADKTF